MARISISDALRQIVIERAKSVCEYCLLHQDDTAFTHPIDHIIALKHGGKTASENNDPLRVQQRLPLIALERYSHFSDG